VGRDDGAWSALDHAADAQFVDAPLTHPEEAAPASFLIELTSVSWGIDSDAGNGCLAEKVLGRT